jgi:hypothetical protein
LFEKHVAKAFDWIGLGSNLGPIALASSAGAFRRSEGAPYTLAWVEYFKNTMMVACSKSLHMGMEMAYMFASKSSMLAQASI